MANSKFSTFVIFFVEMAGVIWSSICKFGILIHLFQFSYISKTSSVSLDLSELRNKVAKIKVNPRGNLWATGNTFLLYSMWVFAV